MKKQIAYSKSHIANSLKSNTISHQLSAISQTGQMVIVLLLITLVALAIALAISQRSLTDITSSNRLEQSSRAFSAAEGGIEIAKLNGPSAGEMLLLEDRLGNQAKAKVTTRVAPTGNELFVYYSDIGKADFAHFWLSNQYTLAEVLRPNSSIDVYFGSITTPSGDSEPSIEINTIVWDTAGSNNFEARRWYFDPIASRRNSRGFSNPSNGPFSVSVRDYCTGVTVTKNYRYRARIDLSSAPSAGQTTTAGKRPIILRVRVIDSNFPQPIAIQPLNCGPGGCRLPEQIVAYDATGTSGETQRRVCLVTQDKVVPYYFDFSIFATSPIIKR